VSFLSFEFTDTLSTTGSVRLVVPLMEGGIAICLRTGAEASARETYNAAVHQAIELYGIATMMTFAWLDRTVAQLGNPSHERFFYDCRYSKRN
jgi:hypothetical protein